MPIQTITTQKEYWYYKAEQGAIPPAPTKIKVWGIKDYTILLVRDDWVDSKMVYYIDHQQKEQMADIKAIIGYLYESEKEVFEIWTSDTQKTITEMNQALRKWGVVNGCIK